MLMPKKFDVELTLCYLLAI